MKTYALKQFKILVLTGILLGAAVSCSKKVDTPAPEKEDEKVKPAFNSTTNGTTYNLEEKQITTTYYASPGDDVKSILSSVVLSSADNLTFFISDFKNGTASLSKKKGSSYNPGKPGVVAKLAVTGTSAGTPEPISVQSYLRFSSGSNIYYATSGGIETAISDKTATIKWTATFKDAAGKEFFTTGTLSLSDYATNTKLKSQIVDPTPVTLVPVIENISPMLGKPGDTVSLSGVNFASIQSENVVRFNGTVASLISSSEVNVKAIVPANATTGPISIKVRAGDVITGPVFTYQLDPQFTKILPNVGKQGDTVVLHGKNFSTMPADQTVKIGGTLARVIAATATELRVIVPENSGKTGIVELKVRNSSTLSGPVFNYNGIARIYSFLPASGLAGDTVVLRGIDFSPVPSDNVVTFSKGLNAKILSSTTASITLVVPEGAVSGTVSITVKGLKGMDAGFTIDKSFPVISWREVYSFSSTQKSNLMVSRGNAILFAGGLNSSYLYFSANGTVFTNVIASLPFNKNKVLDIYSISADENAFYIATSLGIAKSVNGNSWTKLAVDPSLPDLGFTNLVNHDAKNFSAISGTFYYLSSDAGVSWTKAPSDTPDLGYMTSFPSSTKYLFAIDLASHTQSHDATKFYVASASTLERGGQWNSYGQKTGLYNFNDGYRNFLSATSQSVYCAYSPVASPGIANQRLYRSFSGQVSTWDKVSDRLCYVLKTWSDVVAYGGTNFNVSINDGVTFKGYSLPSGYTLDGIDIAGGSEFYIICHNGSGTSKIFRSR